MAEITRMRGLTNDIEIHRDKKGQVVMVKWGELAFRNHQDVTNKQQDIHSQLNLVMKSLENAGKQQVLIILADEAKTLRERLSDVRQIKQLFPSK